MTWARLDDDFDENPKQLSLSDAAFRVWVCSFTFCARQRPVTGFMSVHQAEGLVRKLGKPLKVIRQLTHLPAPFSPAWEEVPGGFLVHDYQNYVQRGSQERTREWRERKRQDGENGDGSVTSPPRHGDSGGDASVTSLPRADAPVPDPEPDVTSWGTPSPEVTPEPDPSHPPLTPPPTGGVLALAAVQSTLSAEYDRFVAELNAATGRHFEGDQESRRKYAVVRRGGRSAADLLAAARGVAKSAHHMGLNDSQMPYNAPINVLRSKVLDQLIALGRDEVGVMRRATADEERHAEAEEWARRRSGQGGTLQ